jgi:hypothetical protein
MVCGVGTKTAKAEPAISRYVSDFIEMAINLFGHVQRWQTRGYYIVWGFPAARQLGFLTDSIHYRRGVFERHAARENACCPTALHSDAREE